MTLPITDVVMVESKIGSDEGDRQLWRYARHLAKRDGPGKRALLYVTRSHDPKKRDEVLRGTEGSGVEFRQKLWRDFHAFLAGGDRQDDSLVRELTYFMEEQNMSGTTAVTLDDLAALSRLPSVLRILADVLNDQVRDEMKRMPARGTKVSRPTLEQIKRDGG